MDRLKKKKLNKRAERTLCISNRSNLYRDATAVAAAAAATNGNETSIPVLYSRLRPTGY